MFRKSNGSPTQDIFGDYRSIYTNRTYTDKLFDSKAWHNLYYHDVYQQIDETLFAALYDQKGMGAPNAPIARLVSMNVIKEMLNISDEKLYELFQLHPQYRIAIGIMNMNDPIPALSTYYLFRKNLSEYDAHSGKESLWETCFQNITRNQVQKYKVAGEHIRMDSKLIGSQISWDSRYVLIHKTVAKFWKQLSSVERQKASPEDLQYLTLLFKEKPDHITYTEKPEQVHQRLVHLGEVMVRLLDIYGKDQGGHYLLLKRLFEEQYIIATDSKIELRPKEQVRSDSLQSPHDPDCSYRSKGDQSSKGYVINAAETCSDDGLQLISSVQCAPNIRSDSSFVPEAIDKSEAVLGTAIKELITDGAYHSPGNDSYAEEHGELDLVYTGMQGQEPRFELIKEGDGLLAKDRRSGSVYPCFPVRKNKGRIKGEKRWRCMVDGKRYYFNEKAVEASCQRLKLAARSKEELQRRNNVEALMYLFGLRLWKNKIRYRGLFRAIAWSFCRALAINLNRIEGYVRLAAS